MVYGVDGIPYISRIVERDVVIDPRGELLAHFLQGRVYAVCGVERVGARQLVHGKRHGRHSVQVRLVGVGVRAYLDARNVPQLDYLSVVGILYDDVFKLLGALEAPLGVYHQLVRRVGVCERGLVEFARRDLLVLLAEGGDDLGGRHVEVRKPVGIEPNAHAVFAGAENLYVADAVHSREPVLHLRDGVVGEIQFVAAAVGRI